MKSEVAPMYWGMYPIRERKTVVRTQRPARMRRGAQPGTCSRCRCAQPHCLPHPGPVPIRLASAGRHGSRQARAAHQAAMGYKRPLLRLMNAVRVMNAVRGVAQQAWE
jgi:hypothetical protein